MDPIKIREILHDRLLVTRASAHELRSSFEAAASRSSDQLEIDFEGVAGMTPSFFDELLATAEETVQTHGPSGIRLVLHHPPTDLSAKFEAVAEGHGCSLSEDEQERWVVAPTAAAAS